MLFKKLIEIIVRIKLEEIIIELNIQDINVI